MELLNVVLLFYVYSFLDKPETLIGNTIKKKEIYIVWRLEYKLPTG